MTDRMCRSTRVTWLAVIFAFALGFTGSANAQLSSTTSGSGGSACPNANDGNGFCGFSTQELVDDGTTFQSRFAWNINADIAVLSTRDTTGSAQHNLSFNATASGSYRLDIATARRGIIQRNADASNCDGAADTSATTGNSNIPVDSGALGLPDPGGIANGGGSTNTPFNQNGSAVIGPRLSNGVAQGHNLTFTWNGSVRSNSCEAAVRQGQQNGSTTGCGACEYPGDPSRTQANDGHFVTVSFTSFCGNGTIDGTGEDCDGGACCNANCTFTSSSTVCRSSGGVCDPEETCTGASPTCPDDVKSTDSCRPALGDCDVEEFCDGVSDDCPVDDFVPSSITCRGVSDVCDVAENCTGSSPSCPPDAFEPSSTVCLPAAGDCDLGETCPGDSPSCPPDAKSTAECRGSAGICDIAESCDGVNDTCPPDDLAPPSTTCRGAAGVCDVAENCTGSSPLCPADAKSTAVCRASGGVCDVTESCDGVGDDCPADGFVSSSVECRASAGVCDVAESCTGSSAACPGDGFASSSTECRASAGTCDPAESCPGSGAACPADALEPSTTECRASAGVCDVAESCTGSAVDCPADAVQPSSLVCRGSAGDCDVTESCDGSGVACPTDDFAPSSQECRADAGDCDVAESCTGTGPTCPADALEPDGTSCNDGMTCTIDDACVAGTCVGDPQTCGNGVIDGSCAEECDDGNTDNGDGCSSTCQAEIGLACGPAPESGCKLPFLPGKAKLIIKDKADDTKDQIIWKWLKGERTTFVEFGTPTTTTSYQLCLYDQNGLELSARIPAGGTCAGKPCWAPIGAKGFKYKDKELSPDGIMQLIVKEGTDAKAKVQVKGKGVNLAMPSLLGLTQPIRVQLANTIGECWEAVYSSPPLKQTPEQFKDKAD